MLTIALSIAVLSDNGVAALRGRAARGKRGAAVLLGILLAALCFTLWATVDLEGTPKFYLSFTLKTFQPWLEAALLVGLGLGLASLVWAVLTDCLAAARSRGRRVQRMLGVSVRAAAAALYFTANLVALTR